MLAESAAMVPETRQRLEAAAAQLQAALAAAEQDLAEGAPVPAEVEAARTAVGSAGGGGEDDPKPTLTPTAPTHHAAHPPVVPVV